MSLRNALEALIESAERLTSHGEAPANPGSRLILTVDVDDLIEQAARARAALEAAPALVVGVPSDEDILACRSWSSHGPTFNRAGVAEWQLSSGGPYGDFWLPAHALPLPGREVQP